MIDFAASGYLAAPDTLEDLRRRTCTRCGGHGLLYEASEEPGYCYLHECEVCKGTGDLIGGDFECETCCECSCNISIESNPEDANTCHGCFEMVCSDCQDDAWCRCCDNTYCSSCLDGHLFCTECLEEKPWLVYCEDCEQRDYSTCDFEYKELRDMKRCPILCDMSGIEDCESCIWRRTTFTDGVLPLCVNIDCQRSAFRDVMEASYAQSH